MGDEVTDAWHAGKDGEGCQVVRWSLKEEEKLNYLIVHVSAAGIFTGRLAFMIIIKLGS